ncbi:hypothetical protein V6N13_133154 [Hibiscus sabdariffa]|uniref:Uncharacterized protein n=2 Tax=Hibiscus sabdariffa TaxID=183260 RepID=A0ABR2ANR9_9ROSI
MGSTAIGSDGEEEALSLCDLSLEHQVQPRNHPIKTDEDFSFGSVGQEMCPADQVFFKGLILPLYGLPGCHQVIQTSRCSESMDHASFTRFTSVSTSSNTNCKFNKEPSPKPPLRSPRTQPVNVGIRNPTSSTWGYFRSGLVRAPELELQDSKVRRNSVGCRNSKLVNSNKGGVVSKRRIMGVYSGCKCSVNVVETVPSNSIVFINNEKQKAMLLSGMEERKKLRQELKVKEKEKGKGKGKPLNG